MTENTSTTINSKLILTQARDTLAMTYWCTGTEFSGKTFFADELDSKMLPAKHIKAKVVSDDGLDRVRIIESVCSIGAMSLAHHMNVNTPLGSFGELEGRDWDCFRAALALLRCIVDSEEYLVELTERPSSAIAAWNDAKSQYADADRAAVIAMFDLACKSPLLSLDSIWVLALPGRQVPPFYLAFAIEDDAKKAIEEARKAHEQRRGSDPYDWEQNLVPWMKSLHQTGYLDSDVEYMEPLELTRDNFAAEIS